MPTTDKGEQPTKNELIPSSDEAYAIAVRFINGHFGNKGELPRCSIPANPKRDDDIRLIAFVNHVADLTRQLTELKRESEALAAQQRVALEKWNQLLTENDSLRRQSAALQEDLKGAADEIGNMLYRFDTLVESLRQVVVIGGKGIPEAQAKDYAEKMLSSANDSREVLAKLNAQLTSP